MAFVFQANDPFFNNLSVSIGKRGISKHGDILEFRVGGKAFANKIIRTLI